MELARGRLWIGILGVGLSRSLACGRVVNLNCGFVILLRAGAKAQRSAGGLEKIWQIFTVLFHIVADDKATDRRHRN